MLLALAAAVVSQAPRTVELTPVGRWSLIIGAASCVVQRSYGSATFALQNDLANDAATSLLLKVPQDIAPTARDKISMTLTLTFRPGGAVHPAHAVSQPVAGGWRLLKIFPDDDIKEGAADWSGVAIANDDVRIDIRLEAMDQAVEALNICRERVIASFGLDPASFRRLGKTEEGGVDMSRIVLAADYPRSAIEGQKQGRAIALVRFDPKGRVADCRVAETAGDLALDKATCGSLRRLHVKPRMGLEGKAVATWSVVQVDWILG